MITPEHSSHRKPNRLAQEKSPYLLQHAYNPVDWYPWGDEAFERARREDKPIFLSVGYSTCYWCHVMEREVFENEEIAAAMNRAVVCIKVDREERPDIDRVYMSALQAMSGSGGWPMSMFLTPDLKPFFGATYIPPAERHGQPGFPQILESVREAWTSEREKIVEAGVRVGEYLAHLSGSGGTAVEPGLAPLDAGFQFFRRTYDSRFAGFGGAPKFPRPVVLNFLFRYYARTKSDLARDMALETLRAMARGGMHDHIGGGFHRYSTDQRWHVPHFEKMLYDQAQLAISYLEAFQISHDHTFSENARDILEYVLRDLSHSDGGFFSAEDAESAPSSADRDHKEEGAFYVWTKNEIDRLLSPDEALITQRIYGVDENGNVQDDPHQVFGGKNVLFFAQTEAEAAQNLSRPESDVRVVLQSARRKLFKARDGRPRCHLDDKILTSWNGLMISAFARAYQVLGEKTYLDTAKRSVRFILSRLRDGSSGELYHRYRDGEARFEGQLDDYAFVIQALLDLYESGFDILWLSTALALLQKQNELFYDEENGGYFDTTGRDSSVLVRTKEWYDGAEPSGNSIAILNLLRIAQFTNDQRQSEMAHKSLSFFGDHLLNSAQATPQFLVALDFSLAKPMQIIVAGRADDPGVNGLLREIHSHYLPRKVMMLADEENGQAYLSSLNPFVGTLKMIDSKPTVYVCENYACKLPTSEPSVLSGLLKDLPNPSIGRQP